MKRLGNTIFIVGFIIVMIDFLIMIWAKQTPAILTQITWTSITAMAIGMSLKALNN